MNKCIHSMQWRFEHSKTCPFCKIAELQATIERVREKAAYFVAEYDENWTEGRVSIDCRDAQIVLKLELEALADKPGDESE